MVLVTINIRQLSSEISYSFSNGYSGSHNNWNNNFNSYSGYRFNYCMRSAEANPEAEAKPV